MFTWEIVPSCEISGLVPKLLAHTSRGWYQVNDEVEQGHTDDKANCGHHVVDLLQTLIYFSNPIDDFFKK